MSQVDCFLKIDGIEGDSQNVQHKGEIAVQSWSWGETMPLNSGSGAGAGKVNVNLQPFEFTMFTSKASPKLFLAAASGQILKTATLTCSRPGQKMPEGFLKITLSDVVVSSFGTSSDTSNLIDRLTLSYAKIMYEFTPHKADGSPDTVVKAGWDVKENKASD